MFLARVWFSIQTANSSQIFILIFGISAWIFLKYRGKLIHSRTPAACFIFGLLEFFIWQLSFAVTVIVRTVSVIKAYAILTVISVVLVTGWSTSSHVTSSVVMLGIQESWWRVIWRTRCLLVFAQAAYEVLKSRFLMLKLFILQVRDFLPFLEGLQTRF